MSCGYVITLLLHGTIVAVRRWSPVSGFDEVLTKIRSGYRVRSESSDGLSYSCLRELVKEAFNGIVPA